jgi:hypothetical protein
MHGLTEVNRRAEEPGRLQLAILEWQRQLIRETERPGRACDPWRQRARAGVTRE